MSYLIFGKVLWFVAGYYGTPPYCNDKALLEQQNYAGYNLLRHSPQLLVYDSIEMLFCSMRLRFLLAAKVIYGLLGCLVGLENLNVGNISILTCSGL